MHFKAQVSGIYEFMKEIKMFKTILKISFSYLAMKNGLQFSFDSRLRHKMEVQRYYKEHYYFSDSDDNDVILAESNNNTLDRLDST